jgi:hypothetical protein
MVTSSTKLNENKSTGLKILRCDNHEDERIYEYLSL